MTKKKNIAKQENYTFLNKIDLFITSSQPCVRVVRARIVWVVLAHVVIYPKIDYGIFDNFGLLLVNKH